MVVMSLVVVSGLLLRGRCCVSVCIWWWCRGLSVTVGVAVDDSGKRGRGRPRKIVVAKDIFDRVGSNEADEVDGSQQDYEFLAETFCKKTTRLDWIYCFDDAYLLTSQKRGDRTDRGNAVEEAQGEAEEEH